MEIAERFLEQASLRSGPGVAPAWRESLPTAEERPEWFPNATATLAERILVNINRAADVNPINLVALAMLAMPKHALSEEDLVSSLGLAKRLLEAVPYSERVTVTPLAPAEIVAYAERMGVLSRQKHPLGDVLVADAKSAMLLTYFRNNVLHLHAAAAWVAACFLNNRRMSRSSLGLQQRVNSCERVWR